MLFHDMGMFHGGPQSQPTAIADWLKLLHENSFVGVLYLNAFDIINYALVGLIFFRFLAALRNLALRALIISKVMRKKRERRWVSTWQQAKASLTR